MQVYNGLKQELTEWLTTATHTPGKEYCDEKGNEYLYTYMSGYISAAHITYKYSMVDNSACKVAKGTIASTEFANGGLVQNNAAAGTYGFTLLKGLGDAYVITATAVNATLQGDVATAGLLVAMTTSPIARVVAKCMETATGVSAATEVLMMVNQ